MGKVQVCGASGRAFQEEGKSINISTEVGKGRAPCPLDSPPIWKQKVFLLCRLPYWQRASIEVLGPGLPTFSWIFNYPMDPLLLTSVALACPECNFLLLVILGLLENPKCRSQDSGREREVPTRKGGLTET